jgi:hypothetical protein
MSARPVRLEVVLLAVGQCLLEKLRIARRAVHGHQPGVVGSANPVVVGLRVGVPELVVPDASQDVEHVVAAQVLLRVGFLFRSRRSRRKKRQEQTRGQQAFTVLQGMAPAA